MVPLNECPSCRASLRIPEATHGAAVTCPKCSTTFTAGATSPSIVPAPPDVLPVQPRAGLLVNWDQPREVSVQRADAPGIPEKLSGKTRSLVAILFLGLCVLSEVVNIGVTLHFYSLYGRALAREEVSDDVVVSRVEHALETGNLCFAGLTSVATAVAFCKWMYVAHRNLVRVFGVKGLSSSSPVWTVLVFFIPILNLYRPYQITQEIFRASDPTLPPNEPYEWGRVDGTVLIGFWWAAWLVANVIAQYAYQRYMESYLTLEERQHFALIEILGGAVSIVAAVLAMFIVKTIQGRQLRRFQRLMLLSSSATH